MFKNPGNKLKSLASLIFAVIVVVFLMIGFAVGIEIDRVLFSLLIIGGIGVIVGWLSSIMLYSFGELVNDVEEIRAAVDEMKRR